MNVTKDHASICKNPQNFFFKFVQIFQAKISAYTKKLSKNTYMTCARKTYICGYGNHFLNDNLTKS